MRQNRIAIALLGLVALLLAANLMVNLTGPVATARADIVEGKNIFSTHAPDGKTIYVWGYTQTGSLHQSNVEAIYYGSIAVDGKFKKF